MESGTSDWWPVFQKWGMHPHFFVDVDYMSPDQLEEELETRVEALGYEMVELERAGSRSRPILRVRIDRPEADAEEGKGITLEDCTLVTRGLEEYLDQLTTLSSRYVLEVSSPGLDRPLVRRRDFERFAGREVAIRGKKVLAERARRLEGELLGIEERDGTDLVRLKLGNGDVVEVPRREVDRAHLVYRWDAG